jgi:hypothetical protein
VLAETAALDLAARGRGIWGRRERQADRAIGSFVGQALSVPAGGVLPSEVREELRVRIDRTIEALETHIARRGNRSQRRAFRDTGVVQQVYALREAQEHLLRTAHDLSVPHRVEQGHRREPQQDRHGDPR